MSSLTLHIQRRQGRIVTSDMERFRRDGFFTLDHFVDADELAVLSESIERRLARPERQYGVTDGKNEVVLTDSVVFEDTAPDICDSVFWRRARDLAATLMESSPEDVSFWGQLLYKPSGQGRDIPWH